MEAGLYNFAFDLAQLCCSFSWELLFKAINYFICKFLVLKVS